MVDPLCSTFYKQWLNFFLTGRTEKNKPAGSFSSWTWTGDLQLKWVPITQNHSLTGYCGLCSLYLATSSLFPCLCQRLVLFSTDVFLQQFHFKSVKSLFSSSVWTFALLFPPLLTIETNYLPPCLSCLRRPNQACASWCLCWTFQKDAERNAGVSRWSTLQRRLWIKQFAQIFKAMVELRFVKVETTMERKKKMNNAGFPHQSANYAPIQKLFLLLCHKIRTFDSAPPRSSNEWILHNPLFYTHLFFILPKLLPSLLWHLFKPAVIRLSSKF